MFALQYYFWIAPHVLLIPVLILIFYRGLQKKHPVFVIFIVSAMMQCVISFAIFFHTPLRMDVYQWFLLIGSMTDAVLELALIHEITNQVLFSRPSVVRTVRLVLCGSLGILALAGALSSTALRSISVERRLNLFEVSEFFSSLVITGLLLTLFTIMRVLRVDWPRRTAGIALGLGILLSINFLSAALRSAFGHPAMVLIDIIDMGSLHVAVVIWLIALSLPERVLKPSRVDVHPADLEVWSTQAQRMVQ
jgi:hypothetical protein